MIKIEDLVQLKAFARQDGAILCLLWAASFMALMYMPESGLGNILALTTPFLVGWRLCSFRNYALGGFISFRRSYGYCAYTFIYASIIFALAQYLYFKFLDNGTFYAMVATSATTMSEVYRQAGMSTQDIDAALGMMKSLSPIHWAFIFMMQDFIVGLVLSLPIAAACRRLRPTANKQG